MRKFLISAALAASTLVAAAPAAAQWAPPQPQGYGYGNYGNRGSARAYQVRIDRLHQRVHRLEGRLSRSEFVRLNRDIDVLQDRVRRAAYRGIGPQESYDLNRRIDRLERTIYRDARDGRGYGDHHGYAQYGYNQAGWSDRDRDGLDDRYERDHGRDYDEDHDRD